MDAFDETHLIVWPMLPDDTDDEPAQRRYDAIAKEISSRVLTEVNPHIAEAFVRVASEVLDRERKRG
ncbi:MAG TPA: hypothetical protein VNA69_13345 [Thermoanaerobaculia bacterium]|nr:hypothetical protein [Thermoanaerobaculia bacterium]